MSRASHLYAAMHERAGAELLNETATDKQLRFMVRVRKGINTTTWLSIIDRLLELGDTQVASGSPAWTIDVSKQYFRKPGLKYGWRIILQGVGVYEHLNVLAEEVRKVVVTATAIEVQEIPLHGSPNRSKTAGLMGQVPIGPAAMRP